MRRRPTDRTTSCGSGASGARLLARAVRSPRRGARPRLRRASRSRTTWESSAARGRVRCEEPSGARHYQGALVAPGGPCGELPDRRLENLVPVKSGVLCKQLAAESCDRPVHSGRRVLRIAGGEQAEDDSPCFVPLFPRYPSTTARADRSAGPSYVDGRLAAGTFKKRSRYEHESALVDAAHELGDGASHHRLVQRVAPR